MSVWYGVRDLNAAREFYVRELGFTEVFAAEEGGWARLARDGAELALARSTEATGAVLAVEVADVKAAAEVLRARGVEVGVVLEIPGVIRLLDVFDPDGNRLQLTEDL